MSDLDGLATLAYLTVIVLVAVTALAIPINWVSEQLDRRDTIRRSQGR